MQAEPLPRVTRSVSEPSAIEADVRRARRAVLEAPRLEQQEKQQEKQQQQQQQKKKRKKKKQQQQILAVQDGIDELRRQC
mmetsp:Transcript_41393/g.102123  ORF Transcript_41393/g.102123 Transcript_41393/m.102123 type:complete len:80 (+) Transcript_41393:130-369(+)